MQPLAVYVLTIGSLLVVFNAFALVLLNRHNINNNLNEFKRRKKIDGMMNQALKTVHSYREYYKD